MKNPSQERDAFMNLVEERVLRKNRRCSFFVSLESSIRNPRFVKRRLIERKWVKQRELLEVSHVLLHIQTA